MKICGLQKVTTIDYPGEIACIVFLHGCNFRCGFCYNPELVIVDDDGETGNRKQVMGTYSDEDVLNFLKGRVGKLDAVCITGGEPLMSLDFDFVRKIREMGFKIKIDTNGSFPGRLKEMIDLGLVDYIAMDIKGCLEDYEKIVNVKVDVSKIGESIRMVHDFGEYEFRTTVVERFHDAERFVRIGKWLNSVCDGKPKRFFLQGFKSGQAMIDSDFEGDRDVGEEFLENMKKSVEGYFEKVEVRI